MLLPGQIRHVHFLGVCGTAMAAVAALLKQRGLRVTGSDDNVYPPMSTFLAEQGITAMAPYAAANLDAVAQDAVVAETDLEVRSTSACVSETVERTSKSVQPDLVVIGNVISRGNPEAEAVLERKLRYASLPEVLREFLIRGKTSIVVTGTHGKTTTTSLLAWTFQHAGRSPGYLIGGIPLNLGQGCACPADSRWFISEGDEYDTAFFDKRSKFIHYLPDTVIINNIEFDHADIFPGIADIELTFRRLINLVPRNGLVLANGDDPNVREVIANAPCPVKTFGLGPDNDLRATDIVLAPDRSSFHVSRFTFHVPLLGQHNVRNALAVAAASLHHGLSAEQIQAAFSEFRGIKRRQEIRGEAAGITVVDDFGHHPTAIRETIRAFRLRFPGRRLWAVFEPRSNTTRRCVFQKELAESLAEADGVFVSQVARLEQVPEHERLSPDKLVADIAARGRPAHYLKDADAIVAAIVPQLRPRDVVAVFSNGSFGGIHGKLLSALKAK
ncbi:MAG: UDP-N-acetylmuramate:L-alanyl-gamma-D-glutamyl-meso-diaminopimelate ligase [Verrucomicrobia bacterium]|nr:UDP-N-acetylmuramate:L-alanyl-gamma-D-glutamyl-meso-diaminopimelate ligase [Verrucomicrobiota bacterium]